MKKLVALLLVTLMVLSAFTLCFSSSAEAAKKDPKFAAADSLTVAGPVTEDQTRLKSKCFYALSGGMQANRGLITKDYTNGIFPDTGKVFYTSVASSANTIDIHCVAKVGGYASVITFKLADGPKKSVVIAVPSSGDANAKNAPKALDIYACDEYWYECGIKSDSNYNKAIPVESSSNRAYTLVLSLKDLDKKWVESADGSFRYYETNLDREFTNNYIAVAFPTNGASGKAYMNEIAVFGSPISEPVTPTPTPAPATGDAFVLFTIAAVVAVVGGTAIVIRKKED